MSKYDDIISLPHPNPKGRQRMSLEQRAAQFAPFAALSGFVEAIEKTRREAQEKNEVQEDDANFSKND